jgi:hypothetical protein
MPKRTNALQKAIKLVEEHKGNFLNLRESAMLCDRYAGIEREVDILLEGEINTHSITVAIEVMDRKRPADTPWVEGMISKHNSLPTDKLILVSSSGFTNPAQEKAVALGAVPIDTSKGDRNFRELLERAAYIQGVRVRALVLVDDSPISLVAKLKIGDSSATIDEQIQVLFKNEKFKEAILKAGDNDEPGIIAEFRSSFSVDDKASREGQILKFVIFIDSIPNVPVKFSTIQYQGVDYIYGEVGSSPHYFVTDINGELVGHEGNA